VITYIDAYINHTTTLDIVNLICKPKPLAYLFKVSNVGVLSYFLFLYND